MKNHNLGQLTKRRPIRMTERDYLFAKEEFLKKLEAVTRFADCSDTDKDERKRKGLEDAFYFAHTYLPHYFSTLTQAEGHQEIVDACQIEEVPIVITGPRGWAKSTIVSFLELVRDFCYNREEFVVLNMKSFERAEMYTMRILVELIHNPRIREDFGELVSPHSAHSNFTTIRSRDRENTTRLAAWGDGMSMRGLVSEYSRPTKIINEDLQDRESAESERRTDKLEKKLKGDYLGAVAARGWKFLVLGNVICEDSLIDRLLKDEDSGWVRIKHVAVAYDELGNARSTWAELMPLDVLLAKKKNMGDDEFDSEYMCEAREVNPAFDRAWFRHWTDLPFKRDKIIIVLDPSLSTIGDNKAMFPMTQHKHELKCDDFGKWFDSKGRVFEEGLYTIILDCWNRKASIEEMFQQMYDWTALYKPYRIYIDGTFGQKEIFRREANRWSVKMGYHLPIKYYVLKVDKTRRILALQPEIETGFLVFPPAISEDTKVTIRQFMRLGKIEDDGPDAIAAGSEMIVKANKAAKFST